MKIQLIELRVAQFTGQPKWGLERGGKKYKEHL